MRRIDLRRIVPLMELAILFLVAGIASPAGSVPGKEGDTEKKPVQTRPAQTRPSQATKATPGKSARPGKPLVFTDEDLKRYRTEGPTASTRPARKPAAPADPLKPFREKEERARWRQERISRMQAQILELEGRLRFLDQKRLSILNPLLPRPAAAQGEEGSPAETGLSGPELLAKTDEAIRQTREQLEAARKELAQFQDTHPE